MPKPDHPTVFPIVISPYTQSPRGQGPSSLILTNSSIARPSSQCEYVQSVVASSSPAGHAPVHTTAPSYHQLAGTAIVPDLSAKARSPSLGRETVDHSAYEPGFEHSRVRNEPRAWLLVWRPLEFEGSDDLLRLCVVTMWPSMSWLPAHKFCLIYSVEIALMHQSVKGHVALNPRRSSDQSLVAKCMRFGAGRCIGSNPIVPNSSLLQTHGIARLLCTGADGSIYLKNPPSRISQKGMSLSTPHSKQRLALRRRKMHRFESDRAQPLFFPFWLNSLLYSLNSLL